MPALCRCRLRRSQQGNTGPFTVMFSVRFLSCSFVCSAPIGRHRAYSMDSVQDLDVQQPPLTNTLVFPSTLIIFAYLIMNYSASSGLEDPSLFPDSIPRRISFSIAPRYTTPPEITYDGGMVQDNVEIGRTNGIDSRGVIGPALPLHSPTGNLFSRLRQAWGGSIGASHIDEDGVADEFEKHLTAMMNCYGMTRSKVRNICHASAHFLF